MNRKKSATEEQRWKEGKWKEQRGQKIEREVRRDGRKKWIKGMEKKRKDK